MLGVLKHCHPGTQICVEVSPSKWKHFGFQDTYVLVLIHVSIQFIELGFLSAMEGIPYCDSAAACLYSRKCTSPSRASLTCLRIRTQSPWRYNKNLDSSLNTCYQWRSHQFKCARVQTNHACRCLLCSRASSQVVLPNNQRSKVDTLPADLPQEHWWKGSSRHGVFAQLLRHNRSRYRSRLAVLSLGQPDLGLGVVRPVSQWRFRILEISH